MFCYVPPVTYFSPKIYNDYENGTPGTFQTFSFGSNVYVMSSVYFVGWGGGGIQYGDENGLSPGSRNKFGHEIRTSQRRTRRQYSFSPFFMLKPIEMPSDSNLPKVGVHQLRSRYNDARRVMLPGHPFFTRN